MQQPVIDDYLADPFIFRSAELYYAIGTGRAEADARSDSHAGAEEASVFPLHVSSDLRSWRAAGRALIRPEPALGDSFWAPEVVVHDGMFYMYYSVGFGDRDHQLRVATSSSAPGPYRDSGAALTSLAVCPFAIDPHPFRAQDGRWYLFHARDFLDEVDERGRRVRPGTALVVHELESMLELCPEGRTILRARWDWQRFQADRFMYGARRDWHTLEGPALLEHGGNYYCFYSGGRWDSDRYGVDYAVAPSLLGPYDDTGGAEGPRLLVTERPRLLGPGHMSTFTAPDGVTPLIAYHAWDAAMTTRRCHIDRLKWTKQGPVRRSF